MAWPLFVWLNLFSQIWLLSTARDVAPQKENYLPDYRIYHNVSSVHATIKRLLTTYPDHLLLHNNYKSGKGRTLPVLRLPPTKVAATVKLDSPKRVLLVFGEHAREFMPVESALHFLELVLSKPNLSFTRMIRSHFDLFIIPMLNPDGRLLIEKTSNYCWRGTATGVDLERNFPWEFGKGSDAHGSSQNQHDEEYRGKTPFSESESRLIRDLSGELTFDAALSVHSGIRHIYTPYSDSVSRKTGRKPDHWKSMGALAAKMKVAMGNNPKHSFKAGPASVLNDYAADGTLFDYLAGVRHVPVSLVVELWGVGDVAGVKCFDLFNPPSNLLKDELKRLTPLYEAFFNGLWTLRSNFTVAQHSLPPRPGSLPPYPLIALVAVILVIIGLLIKRQLRASNTTWRLLASGRKRVVSLRSFSSRFSGLTGLKSV